MCIVLLVMGKMARLMGTSWVLIVRLERGWRRLLATKATSSLSHASDVHHALALASAVRAGTAILSAHHNHGIEIICVIDEILWVSVLAILVVNG